MSDDASVILPPRNGGCDCLCHVWSAVSHVAPCCYPDISPEPPRKWSMLITEQHTLHQWGHNLHNAFPHAWVLHVGSSLVRSDYRDVDVRVVLEDDEFDRLAAMCDVRVLAVALSYWGQTFTRLPIDCQLQRNSDQQTEDGPRNSIGGLPEQSSR